MRPLTAVTPYSKRQQTRINKAEGPWRVLAVETRAYQPRSVMPGQKALANSTFCRTHVRYWLS